MLLTDKPKKKMKEETVVESQDKKGKGSGSKDACWQSLPQGQVPLLCDGKKVRVQVLRTPVTICQAPALVKCRRVGNINWGNSSKNEEFMKPP